MKAVLLIVALSFCLNGCKQEEEASREEARVQAEVSRRVETIRAEMKTSETRWHTVRVACYCLLAGGSLIALMSGLGRGGGTSSREQVGSNRYEPNPSRRVIDRPYDPYDEPEDDPYRR